MPRCDALTPERCEEDAAFRLVRFDGSAAHVCWSHRPKDPSGYAAERYIGGAGAVVVPIGAARTKARRLGA